MKRALCRLIPLVVACALAGCATVVPAPAPATPQPPPAASVPPPAEPTPQSAATPAPVAAPATDHPSLAIHWVRDSAEYRAAAIQTYRLAAAELERLAGVLTPGRWAVALDADETVIDNSLHEKELRERGERFNRASWKAWVERQKAPPVPGAVGFLTTVHRLGGRIAIVTNRDHDLCPDTEENFHRYGIPYDLMLCKPASGKSAKQPRWDAVEAGTAAPGVQPLEIVLYVGDNIQDFPRLDQDLRRGPEGAFADFGSVYFILPNPMYGSWVDNPAE
jgi:5'-nucleotidase (lipoprotein e(P4) family)